MHSEGKATCSCPVQWHCSWGWGVNNWASTLAALDLHPCYSFCPGTHCFSHISLRAHCSLWWCPDCQDYFHHHWTNSSIPAFSFVPIAHGTCSKEQLQLLGTGKDQTLPHVRVQGKSTYKSLYKPSLLDSKIPVAKVCCTFPQQKQVSTHAQWRNAVPTVLCESIHGCA